MHHARITRSLPAAVAVLTVAALQTSCGGGIGEAAFATFLGTGGGQFVAEPRPLPAGYALFDDGITLSLTAGQPDTRPPDLYARAYDVFVFSVTGDRLAGCEGRSGRVDGTRMSIPGCFVGRYETLNRLVSDDGTLVLHHSVDPDLNAGLWVDVDDSDHAFKFAGATVACEYRGTERRPATVVRRSASVEQAEPGAAFTAQDAGIASLVVSGGTTWTGEFVGISGLRLSGGGRTVELQRQDKAPPSPCP